MFEIKRKLGSRMRKLMCKMRACELELELKLELKNHESHEVRSQTKVAEPNRGSGTFQRPIRKKLKNQTGSLIVMP